MADGTLVTHPEDDKRRDTLLTTKLYVPKARTTLLSRPRLIQRLDEALTRKLTLVCAPAGFGKSTLLHDWTNQNRHPVAWLSLDPGDNDPVRFWSYVNATLGSLHATLRNNLEALLRDRPTTLSPIVTTLINELTDLPEEVVLVLDDYHAIHSQEIHDSVALLIGYLPPRMHLILASRADPLLPLSRLRAQGHLTEIRADELRFTLAEAEAYLRGLDLALPARDVQTLSARTEGWIVGLQLVALSLREQAHPSEFIRDFAGDNRYVLDYLLDEVFTRQSEEVKDFLLKTSLLERLCAPLCDALVYPGEAAGRGQAMLEYLEQANLFIIPLDSRRYLYRYHHLFADLLRNRLNRLWTTQVPDLHRRAAAWLDAQDWTDEALPHILAVGDYAWAGRLVEATGATTLWGHGEIATLLGWLERLPRSLVDERPRLALLYAWIFYQTSQLDKIGPYLERAGEHLRKMDAADEAQGPGGRHNTPAKLTPTERNRLLGEMAVIRAFVARLEERWEQVESDSREALSQLPEAELRLRGLVSASLAESYYLRGDIEAAGPACLEASALCQESDTLFPALWMLRRVAEVQFLQASLHRVADTCRTMREVAERHDKQHLAVAGMADIQQGELLREWNQLEVAAELLRTGIEGGQRVANPRIYQAGYIALARVLQAQGRGAEALAAIDEAVRAERPYQASQGWGLPPATAYRARLWLAQGEVAAAARWAQERELDTSGDPSYRIEVEQLTLARLLLAQGRGDAAVGWLERLCQAARQGGRTARVIEALALLALAHYALGRSGKAIEHMDQARVLAEPGGYIRLFADEGEPMARLLAEMAVRGPASAAPAPYLSELRAAVDPTSVAAVRTARQVLSGEPLSVRELAVLRLLVARQTNKEIARELALSVNTVKWYARNIYEKLGVHSRYKAAARARELGLV